MRKKENLIEKLEAVSIPYPNIIDLTLDRVLSLLDKIGNPHLKLPPIIHVAGTNGKGSTIAFISSILRASGKKLHIYTSPHLTEINERIVISNKKVAYEELISALDYCVKKKNFDPITQYELLTCASFYLMSQHNADIAIIETGLGGRLDATNVHPSPLISIITPISYDHEHFLGNKLKLIAREKAGIIKKGVKCISSFQLKEAEKELESAAKRVNAELLICGKNWGYKKIANGFKITEKRKDLFFPLPKMEGFHQIENAALATYSITKIESLDISKKYIDFGILNAVWKGRLEKINKGYLKKIKPKGYEIWVDGGHNVSAAKAIREWIKQEKNKYFVEKFVLISAFLKTKDVSKMLKIIGSTVDEIMFVQIPGFEKYYPIEKLRQISNNLRIKNSDHLSIDLAIKNISPVSSGRILIFGSLYLVGAALELNDYDRC